MSKSVWSRIADGLQKLWRLLGQPSKPTPPVYFVPERDHAILENAVRSGHLEAVVE
jgi:hypothetical protein